jgi:hypothetical protein
MNRLVACVVSMSDSFAPMMPLIPHPESCVIFEKNDRVLILWSGFFRASTSQTQLQTVNCAADIIAAFNEEGLSRGSVRINMAQVLCCHCLIVDS